MLWRKKPTSGYGYALSILNLYQWLIQVTNKSWSELLIYFEDGHSFVYGSVLFFSISVTVYVI